jgi:hypothetical protein
MKPSLLSFLTILLCTLSGAQTGTTLNNSFPLIPAYPGTSKFTLIDSAVKNCYSDDFFYLSAFPKKTLNLKFDSLTIKAISNVVPSEPWYAIEGFRPIITSKGTWYLYYPMSLVYVDPRQAQVFFNNKSLDKWYARPPIMNRPPIIRFRGNIISSTHR